MDARSKRRSSASASNRTLVELANPLVPEISIPAPLSRLFNGLDINSIFKWFHSITFQKIPHLFFSLQLKICNKLLLLLTLYISCNNLQSSFFLSLSLSLSLGLFFFSHSGKIALQKNVGNILNRKDKDSERNLTESETEFCRPVSQFLRRFYVRSN